MKVIRTDNFDRETVSDILVAEGLPEEEAKERADKENARKAHDAWHVVKPEDYKLYVWEP